MEKTTLGQIPELMELIKSFFKAILANDFEGAMAFIDSKMLNPEKLSKQFQEVEGMTDFPVGYLNSIEIEYEKMGDETLYYPNVPIFINGQLSKRFLNLSALSVPGKPIEMLFNAIE